MRRVGLAAALLGLLLLAASSLHRTARRPLLSVREAAGFEH